jgi:dTDP-4-amino-4,6-dideoxygalactose transaminase
MTVPFLDLQALHAPLRPEIDAAIGRVLDSGIFILGPEVEAFEREFAEWCGGGEAIAVNSGTSALHLALLASGIGPDDEVITVSMTFVATVAAIVYCGATPVMVDVDPLTWTMDPVACEAAITPRTKAIMPVHLHGQMADVEALREIAEQHGLVLIEDAAQAHGASRGGNRAGLVGTAAGFSFYPGKNLGAIGEGGAVLTRDPMIAERVRLLRDWGAREKYVHEEHAFNFRMDAIQGAILRVKLRQLSDWTSRRQAVAERYAVGLADLGIQTPTIAPDSDHVFHVYALAGVDQQALRGHLQAEGIGAGIHYPIPVHKLPAYSHLESATAFLPITDHLATTFVSIPMSPTLNGEDADAVCAGVRGFAALA